MKIELKLEELTTEYYKTKNTNYDGRKYRGLEFKRRKYNDVGLGRRG